MDHDQASRSFIGVYPPDRVARITEGLARLGVPDDAVHLAERDDVDTSLHAEQVEEARESLVMPAAGVLLPKEPTKSVSIAIPVAAVIGAALAFPFAFIHVDSMSFWVRAFWLVAVGATMGGTIAYIVGSAMALRDPHTPSAAQRGVVVRVDDARPEVGELLRGLDPIRLDLLSGSSTVIGTVTTEEDREQGGIVEEVADNVRREAEAPPTRRHR